ncbi:MAG: peptide chain release factor N(5)-glutamine methyltransferase [Mailhella sp.]|nr:peptide chain release factor N(5)-glutamine methyltransferase [Mailhella sp.]
MTRKEWKLAAASALAGTDAPLLSAEMILRHVLGIGRVELIVHSGEELSAEERSAADRLLARRLAGEPTAYLMGSREFYGRDFAVGPAVLIPRPETEHLIDAALEFFKGRGDVRFLDLGTGSGCIALTLAAERPGWTGAAVDVSPEALAVAERNARALDPEGRVELVRADFTGDLPFPDASFDLVVSNPPYISEEEYAGLDACVRNFEPRGALVPGPTGMEHPQAVERAARRLLRGGGLFLMEHGWLQGESCRGLCSARDWTGVRTGRDYAGLDRFLYAERRI